MTYTEKLQLIDEFLEEPNSNDARWVEMLTEYREMLENKYEHKKHT